MCGIAGVFNFDSSPVSPAGLKKMAEALKHRGPDGEGFFLDRHVGFAHRRLSIIDLSSAGNQPMLSNDGRYALVYNGEIYNFQELRALLEDRGYRFNSRSDSEVVLNAYIEWGEDALSKFNGMFAFGVWDKKREELFLARDRYGIKPLYIARQNGRLLFASEIKAFRAYGEFKFSVSIAGLMEYMTFQNFLADQTLVKDVSLFPAGSWLKVRAAEDLEKAPQKFWDFWFQPDNSGADPAECREELDRLFSSAVHRQLVSDVEVGAYLSGGMDSGSITALAAQRLPYLKTFTVGFDVQSASGIEMACDERDIAEHMSYLFKTEHYEMVLKAGDMERVMPKLAWHLEEPRVGQSYPNYYAAQLASKFCKVVLAGTGGDEMFGGYPWRYYAGAVNKDTSHYLAKYYRVWQRLADASELQSLLQPVWGEAGKVDCFALFRAMFPANLDSAYSPEEYVNLSLTFEARTFLRGLLIMEDKFGMAHGLETRLPFLDNQLVDFALKLPVGFKLGNLDKVVSLNETDPGPRTREYFTKTRDGKLIFREAMRRYIPAEVSAGCKQGFSGPDEAWFKGESIEYVRGVIFNNNSPLYMLFDPKATQALVSRHLDGIENRRLLIWSLLSLNQFLITFS